MCCRWKARKRSLGRIHWKQKSETGKKPSTSNTDEENDVDTEETEDTDEEEEDVTEAEEAESEAEMDALELDLYDMMNGEAAEDGEGTEEETIPEGDGWDILGTFYVFKQQNNNDGTVTLQCFDGFQLMNDPYIPAQKNGTFQQFYDDIRAQCQAKGIIVDEETFEAEMNPVLEWNQDCTLREAGIAVPNNDLRRGNHGGRHSVYCELETRHHRSRRRRPIAVYV